MTRVILIMVCVISMFSLSSSISCVTYYSFSSQEKSNCSGDACVTYIYSGSPLMMGCATNVIFSNRTGCYGDSEDNVICSCQSDNCNDYDVDTIVNVKEAPKTSCFGHSASMCKGLACTVAKVDNVSSDACGVLGPSPYFIELHANSIILEQTTKDAYVDDKYLAILGKDFRANCMTSKCVELARKLRSEGLKSKKPKVECHSYIQDNYNNLTCNGDFCYYQEEDGGVYRGCYTVEDRFAERKLSVGVYEYFNQRTYLCNQDLCNEDEAHANDNRSPDMGRSFTWPTLGTFETTTDGALQIVSIWVIMISVWMLIRN